VALLAAKRRKEAAEKALQEERQRAAQHGGARVKQEGGAQAPIRVRYCRYCTNDSRHLHSAAAGAAGCLRPTSSHVEAACSHGNRKPSGGL